MSNSSPSKYQLRQQLRGRRLQLTDEERRSAALAAARHAGQLPAWAALRQVAVYLPANGEMDTGPLVTSCRAQGKALYLPVIRHDRSLEFALWLETETLTANRFGIPEPANTAPRRAAADLDIIFMPLVGWDRAGNRLGMGGGFYDRTLTDTTVSLRVGLAYDCQRAEDINPEPWDIPLTHVVTETALYRCGFDAPAGTISPG
jgi:5-formyltetrahydrofolate cyclo-ligase